MFAKLLLIILTIIVTAAVLMITRQQRIDAMHEMSGLHQRLVEQEASLWILRSRIADRSRPQQVREAVKRLGGEWMPIPNKPVQGAPPAGGDFASQRNPERIDGRTGG
jgi:hypothetical protein